MKAHTHRSSFRLAFEALENRWLPAGLGLGLLSALPLLPPQDTQVAVLDIALVDPAPVQAAISQAVAEIQPPPLLGGGVTDIGALFTEPGLLDGATTVITEIVEPATNLVSGVVDVLAPVVDAADPILGGLDDLAEPILTVVEPVLAPALDVVGEVAGSILDPAIELVDPLIETITPITEAVGQVVGQLNETVVEPLLEAVNIDEILDPVVHIVEPVLEPVVSLLEPVVDLVEPVVEVLEPVVDLLEPVIDLVVVEVLEPVVDLLEPVVDLVEPVVEVLEPVVDLLEPVIDLVVVEVLEPVVDLLEPVVDLLEPVVEVLEPVVALLEPVIEVLEPVVDLLEPVVDLLEPVIDVVDPVVDVVDPVVELVEPVVDLDDVEPVIDVVEPVVEVVIPGVVPGSGQVLPSQDTGAISMPSEEAQAEAAVALDLFYFLLIGGPTNPDGSGASDARAEAAQAAVGENDSATSVGAEASQPVSEAAPGPQGDLELAEGGALDLDSVRAALAQLLSGLNDLRQEVLTSLGWYPWLIVLLALAGVTVREYRRQRRGDRPNGELALALGMAD